MTGTSTDRPRRPSTWRERLFVLGGFAVAALYTAASLAILGIRHGGHRPPLDGRRSPGRSSPPSLALALWQRLASTGDWSAFRDYEPAGRRRATSFDWGTRTGSVRISDALRTKSTNG